MTDHRRSVLDRVPIRTVRKGHPVAVGERDLRPHSATGAVTGLHVGYVRVRRWVGGSGCSKEHSRHNNAYCYKWLAHYRPPSGPRRARLPSALCAAQQTGRLLLDRLTRQWGHKGESTRAAFAWPSTRCGCAPPVIAPALLRRVTHVRITPGQLRLAQTVRPVQTPFLLEQPGVRLPLAPGDGGRKRIPEGLVACAEIFFVQIIVPPWSPQTGQRHRRVTEPVGVWG